MTDEQTAQGHTAAPEANEKPITRTWTDAPASANVRACIGGHDWQLTLRADTFAQLSERIPVINEWLDKHNGKKQGGQTQVAQAAPQPPAAPVVPPPPPAAPQPVATGGESVCQMIEVGLSYKGQKLQLKFHCNGLDNPLLYTKPIEEMAALIAPLGFTQAHIVNGQKYATSALISWTPYTKDGKTYRNIVTVKAGA